MEIKLDYYEVVEAIEAHINSKGCNFDLHKQDNDFWVTITTAIRQEKKHKNGRIVKNEHGYPETAITGYETKNHCFGDGDEITLWINE